MRIDAIAIGNNPPDDVNVIIEVPLGGQPIKYELDKDAGVLIMEDNAGQDEKVIAVPGHALTQRYDEVLTHTDLPDITLEQIEHFFEHYKDLEPGKWVKIGDWHGTDMAKRLISQAIDRAKA